MGGNEYVNQRKMSDKQDLLDMLNNSPETQFLGNPSPTPTATPRATPYRTPNDSPPITAMYDALRRILGA